MSKHMREHEEKIIRFVFDGEPREAADVVAQIVDCEECVTVAARLAEDTILVGSPRAARAERLLDEVVAWQAIRDDAPAPVPETKREPVKS